MKGHEKTLIILTPGFAKDEADSTCIPTQQNFVRALNEIYPRLHVVIIASDYPYTKKTYSWFNSTVISFDGRNRGGLSRLLLRRRILSVLKKIHETNDIAGILSFWLNESAFVGKRFAEKNGLKHICWIWGQDAKKGNRYVQQILPKSDELVALSDFLQEEFEKNYGIRPKYIIPPGISIKQFNTEVQARDIDILAAGSLIPLKQYEIFIQVVAEIKKQFPGIKAMLIGDGPERSELQKLIILNNLQSNVSMAGEMPHHKTLATMQRAKIFLHPSSYEGFGVVCIEALCAGLEVISFVRPMNKKIEHWHIVSGKEEMIQQSMEILRKPGHDYKSVIPYRAEESVQQMMELFAL